MRARSLITGPATRITANGGDDDALNNWTRGAGGGRVAITATDRFDIADAASEFQARGGRNFTIDEGRTYGEGGAGSLFLKKPGAPIGELIDELAKLVSEGKTITLLCSSACTDASHCHWTLLQQLIEKKVPTEQGGRG